MRDNIQRKKQSGNIIRYFCDNHQDSSSAIAFVVRKKYIGGIILLEDSMRWFRIGSFVLLATCVIHVFGHFGSSTPANDTERQLMELMTGYRLPSIDRTMMDLLNGFSLFFSLFYLMTGELNLWLSRAYKEQPGELRKVAVVNIIGLGIGTGLSYYYFFLAPALCITIALAFYIVAFFTLRDPKETSS